MPQFWGDRWQGSGTANNVTGFMMVQTVSSNSSGRQAALARRQAMSRGGKVAAGNGAVSATTAKPIVYSSGSANTTGRAASLARRQAMSTGGKHGVSSSDRVRKPVSVAAKTLAQRDSKDNTPAKRSATTTRKSSSVVVSLSSSRAVVLARRQAMSAQGKRSVNSSDRVRGSGSAKTEKTIDVGVEKTTADCGCGCGGDKAVEASATTSSRSRMQQRSVKVRTVVQASATNNSRVTALARRQAMSARGKAGVSANGMSAAQTVRAANPLISGRELAQALRTQRSRQGKTGQKKNSPTGRIRPAKNASVGAAQDAPWKVGAGETSSGQTVTGTMVGRSHKTTGDEPSTCRDVTGTEYMGADIFRDFCQAEPGKMPPKVGLSATLSGNSVTGNELGRSHNVTGDEPGSCQQVTGVEYLAATHSESFCGGQPESAPAKVEHAETQQGKSVTGNEVGHSSKVTGNESGADRELTGNQYMQTGDGHVPPKVGVTNTLRGGAVTGTMVGRSERVTGDEPGSCRIISGDDYVGGEQYRDFCTATPVPQDAKVGASQTFNGKLVTGTMTGRSDSVTGDEPGTCKTITGTGYAGAEQYYNYCKPEAAAMAAARTSVSRGTSGAVMSGQQPSIGGKMTGGEKGSCESLTGTPYIGADQFADACPATAAEPASPDFPQPLGGDAPWGKFSVGNMATQVVQDKQANSVTGTLYTPGQITGPFGMATGKVTGAADGFHSIRPNRGSASAESPRPKTVDKVEGRVKSRISGEGMGSSKITGNDWDIGDLVTGTEGRSAMQRNPTRRGSAIALAPPVSKRNETLSEPVSKVTGGSGSTEKGSLVTYSGGARG